MATMKSPAAHDWTVTDAYSLLRESKLQQYEIIDGELVVSDLATERHQIRCADVADVLRAACPDDLRVFYAPINIDIGERLHLEPDVTVKRRADFENSGAVPLLVVEVLSPSTWRHDVRRKREVYARIGVPSYWLLEPHAPSLTLLRLVDGAYVEDATVGPGEEHVTSAPYDVRLAPGEWSQLD
jgi:Uma2 family endonuclease